MPEPTPAPFALADITVSAYRAPISRPVRTAFGVMTDRPAVIVRAVERDGTTGFGEVWSNFPQCGAEHRARLVKSALVPLLLDRSWRSPAEAFDHLAGQLRILALQAGEPGPVAQAIAGVDIALWDLVAKRAGLPLWRMLGGAGKGRVPAYASGISPCRTVEQAAAARNAGHHAFKLKVGFGRERDLANLEALRALLGDDAPIMVDANQAWDLPEAIAMSERLAPCRPIWLEEPIAADSPGTDWRQLAQASPIPLAAGENLRGDAAFDQAIASGVFAVIQPDLAKWGGISKGLALAHRIARGGARYCPHCLGGGIGLLASAHLLAASGGDGLLEIDSNPNPLREGLATPFPKFEDGALVLSETPGLGVEPSRETDRYAQPLFS